MKTDKKVKPVTNASSLLKLRFLMMHEIIRGGGWWHGRIVKTQNFNIIVTDKQQQL